MHSSVLLNIQKLSLHVAPYSTALPTTAAVFQASLHFVAVLSSAHQRSATPSERLVNHEHLLPCHFSVVTSSSVGSLHSAQHPSTDIDRRLQAMLLLTPDAGRLEDVTGLVKALDVELAGATVDGALFADHFASVVEHHLHGDAAVTMVARKSEEGQSLVSPSLTQRHRRVRQQRSQLGRCVLCVCSGRDASRWRVAVEVRS